MSMKSGHPHVRGASPGFAGFCFLWSSEQQHYLKLTPIPIPCLSLEEMLIVYIYC